MKNVISTLNDHQLKTRFERLARTERKLTALIVEYISEIARRDLHLLWGYANLFEYLTKGMGYSESAAYRRLQAARALRMIPEIKTALEDGSLKLSQVSQVQTALRKEELVTGEKISIAARVELFNEVAGKSGVATQRLLDATLPHQNQSVSREVHRRDESVELTIQVSKDDFAQLQRVKELYSHIDPYADWAKVIALMAKDVIRKRDPLVQKAKKSGTARVALNAVKSKTHSAGDSPNGDREPIELMTQGFAATEVEFIQLTPQGVPISPKRTAIPAPTRRLVFQRDLGRCQYHSPHGRRCGSRFQTEIDHILPVHAGGTNDVENLRVLCRNHNQFTFGY